VLDETIEPLVAPHLDVGHQIDPKPRGVTPRNAAIEQINAGRNLDEYRIQFVIEDFEPCYLGVSHLDDHAGSFRRLDARLPQGITQGRRAGRRLRLVTGRPRTSPHYAL